MKQFFSDIFLFFKSYPLAKRIVIALHDHAYPGVVKAQIAYQKLETELLQVGHTAISGSVLYITVSLAYYFNRRKTS
jgi:hypothetical protein